MNLLHRIRTEASDRDEFRTPVSPDGIRFVQVTSRAGQTAHLGGYSNQKWTRDSKTFLIIREAAEDRSAAAGIWACHVDQGFALNPVVEFPEGRNHGCLPARGHGECLGAELLTDGSGVVHVHHVDERFEIRLTTLDGSRTETVSDCPATIACRWMSVSGDSERVAFGVFLGDGRTEGAPWASRIFDLRRRTWWDIVLGNQFRRAPGQHGYTFTDDPVFSHFIATDDPGGKLSDGSWLTPPDGQWRWQEVPPPVPGRSCLRVYHDVDGKWGVVPLPGGAYHGSHGTWRGTSFSFVEAMYHTGPDFWRAPFIEADPVPCGPEQAHEVPPAFVDLSRRTCRADACHFGFDHSGRHLVSDTDGYVYPGPNLLYVATRFAPEGEDPYVKTQLLGITRTSWRWQPDVQASHPHPNLSPDGKYAIFQSDFFDRPQVVVVTNFEYPE